MGELDFTNNNDIILLESKRKTLKIYVDAFEFNENLRIAQLTFLSTKFFSLEWGLAELNLGILYIDPE